MAVFSLSHGPMMAQAVLALHRTMVRAIKPTGARNRSLTGSRERQDALSISAEACAQVVAFEHAAHALVGRAEE